MYIQQRLKVDQINTGNSHRKQILLSNRKLQQLEQYYPSQSNTLTSEFSQLEPILGKAPILESLTRADILFFESSSALAQYLWPILAALSRADSTVEVLTFCLELYSWQLITSDKYGIYNPKQDFANCQKCNNGQERVKKFGFLCQLKKELRSS